ncbi:MAG: hypothetical protein NTV34_07915 [Proteobacteria bacterium]|nr:hypothetical protein [Pseudomonadota bacterium]
MKFWEKLEDILTPFEFLAFLCLGFVAIDIPLALAFQHKPSSFETAADILISVILGLEFFRYQTKNQIAPHQNGTRAMELIAAVPFLAICTTLLAIDSNIAIYLQGFHLLRAPRLISTMLNRNKDKILPKRFKFLVAGFITTVVLNTFACGWLLIYPANEDSYRIY